MTMKRHPADETATMFCRYWTTEHDASATQRLLRAIADDIDADETLRPPQAVVYNIETDHSPEWEYATVVFVVIDRFSLKEPPPMPAEEQR